MEKCCRVETIRRFTVRLPQCPAFDSVSYLPLWAQIPARSLGLERRPSPEAWITWVTPPVSPEPPAARLELAKPAVTSRTLYDTRAGGVFGRLLHALASGNYRPATSATLGASTPSIAPQRLQLGRVTRCWRLSLLPDLLASPPPQAATNVKARVDPGQATLGVPQRAATVEPSALVPVGLCRPLATSELLALTQTVALQSPPHFVPALIRHTTDTLTTTVGGLQYTPAVAHAPTLYHTHTSVPVHTHTTSGEHGCFAATRSTLCFLALAHINTTHVTQAANQAPRASLQPLSG
ncbi:hypothetical protein V8E36_007526 [Tilletia maclaganii]